MKKNENIVQVIGSFVEYLSRQPKGFLFNDQKDKETMLQELYAPYRNCTRCPLGTMGRTNVVFGEGNPDAHLMFVGEGPGRNEDEQGRPFVGRAGKLLNKIIEAMGLKREDTFIANVVKCRPPGNRAPTPLESGTCKKLFLFSQIAIVKPRIICTLGASATQGLLGEKVRLSQTRGRFHQVQDYLIMPTYHPAYLLRNPAEKKTVWQDMQKIMEKLSEFK